MVIEELATRLKELVVMNYKPGEKLPSERELALRLDSTQSRIHRAIAILIREGILSTKANSGTFFLGKTSIGDNTIALQNNSYSSDSTLLFSIQLNLKVKVILDSNVSEKLIWEEIFRRFTKEYPYIHIEPIFLERNTEVQCDVWISNLHNTHRLLSDLWPMNFQELSRVGFSFHDLIDGCQALMSTGGGLYRLPIMRIPSSLFVNLKLLEKTTVTPAELNAADNIFGQATRIQQESKKLPMIYRGYHWHGCNYGLFITEKDGQINLDWNLLEKLICDTASYVNKNNYTFSRDAINLFAQNELVLLHAHYPSQGMSKSGDIADINPCREKIGFRPETITTASVLVSSQYRFEAQLFAAFLSTEDIQTFLVSQMPGWLPVNKAVLGKMNKTTVSSLDQRPYYSLYSQKIFYDFGPRINYETAKYYLHLQSLEETISNLKAITQKHL